MCNGPNLAFAFDAPRYISEFERLALSFDETKIEAISCDAALREAGFARFEHGESGAPSGRNGLPWSSRK